MLWSGKHAAKLPELPYEIWLQIAHFIPRDKRHKLINFHRAFFDLAMDEVYRDIRIYHKLDESTLRCLFMSALAARRVRTLTLRPHLFGESMPTTGRLSFMWKSLKSQMGKNKRSPNDRPNPARTQCLLRKVKQMTNLTSLTVGCYSYDDWKTFNKATAFLDAAWTHSWKLRMLKLDIPLECAKAFLSTSPHFPVLENLDISIRVESINEMHADTLSKLATFINLQSSTLIHLSIDVTSLKIDPSRLFSGIRYLPKLTAVAIGQPAEPLHSESHVVVNTFLRKHRLPLKELRIFYDESANSYKRPTPRAFFSSSIFQLDFPSLKTLHLGICYWNSRIDTSLSEELVKYLSKFRYTLTELAISNDTLCFPAVQKIISLFGGVDIGLRCLQIRVHYLSWDLLDLLSLNLPHLHELVLDVYSIRAQDDGRTDPSYPLEKVHTRYAVSFVMQATSRRYISWGLRHLMVHGPQYNSAGIWNKGREKLVASLPNVFTFNGVSRTEFLSRRNHNELNSPSYAVYGRSYV